jgi:poly-gamma-glutamate synthesis protein (capsule biosynthesis protein)
MFFFRGNFRRILILSILFLSVFLPSCSSTKTTATSDSLHDTVVENESSQNKPLTILFAGDIMAHEKNYQSDDFSSIWTDVSQIIKGADVSFANIEAPVDDAIPWSSFPNFNMHSSYTKAAIGAGFTVFSLANNHSNDQGLKGLQATNAYFKKTAAASAKTDRPIYACGIKDSKNGPLTYQIIEKNGWKILFAAVTLILNRPDYSDWIDYFSSAPGKRNELVQKLASLRALHACDLFIVSVHTDEEEYVQGIDETSRSFYKRLYSEAGADIVWANHPHVVKAWELYGTVADNKLHGLVMFANGNTISAQRHTLNKSDPAENHEYTGDGLLLRVTVVKNSAESNSLSSKNGNKNSAQNAGSITIENAEPLYITTYIDPSQNFVVRLLDDDFIHSLERSGLTAYAHYYQQRKELMEKIKGTTQWQ